MVITNTCGARTRPGLSALLGAIFGRWGAAAASDFFTDAAPPLNAGHQKQALAELVRFLLPLATLA